MGVWLQQGFLAEPITRFGSTVSQQLPSQPAQKDTFCKCFCVAIFSARVSGEMFFFLFWSRSGGVRLPSDCLGSFPSHWFPVFLRVSCFESL